MAYPCKWAVGREGNLQKSFAAFSRQLSLRRNSCIPIPPRSERSPKRLIAGRDVAVSGNSVAVLELGLGSGAAACGAGAVAGSGDGATASGSTGGGDSGSCCNRAV